jgi:hypothetical protein
MHVPKPHLLYLDPQDQWSTPEPGGELFDWTQNECVMSVDYNLAKTKTVAILRRQEQITTKGWQPSTRLLMCIEN